MRQISLLKCPNCPCVFCAEDDLKAHMTAFGSEHLDKFKKLHKKIEFGGEDDGERKEGWRKGKYGGEWRFAMEMPEISSAIRANGKVTMNGYNMTLDPTGKYLRRDIARM